MGKKLARRGHEAVIASPPVYTRRLDNVRRDVRQIRQPILGIHPGCNLIAWLCVVVIGEALNSQSRLRSLRWRKQGADTVPRLRYRCPVLRDRQSLRQIVQAHQQ